MVLYDDFASPIRQHHYDSLRRGRDATAEERAAVRRLLDDEPAGSVFARRRKSLARPSTAAAPAATAAPPPALPRGARKLPPSPRRPGTAAVLLAGHTVHLDLDRAAPSPRAHAAARPGRARQPAVPVRPLSAAIRCRRRSSPRQGCRSICRRAASVSLGSSRGGRARRRRCQSTTSRSGRRSAATRASAASPSCSPAPGWRATCRWRSRSSGPSPPTTRSMSRRRYILRTASTLPLVRIAAARMARGGGARDARSAHRVRRRPLRAPYRRRVAESHGAVRRADGGEGARGGSPTMQARARGAKSRQRVARRPRCADAPRPRRTRRRGGCRRRCGGGGVRAAACRRARRAWRGPRRRRPRPRRRRRRRRRWRPRWRHPRRRQSRNRRPRRHPRRCAAAPPTAATPPAAAASSGAEWGEAGGSLPARALLFDELGRGHWHPVLALAHHGPSNAYLVRRVAMYAGSADPTAGVAPPPPPESTAVEPPAVGLKAEAAAAAAAEASAASDEDACWQDEGAVVGDHELGGRRRAPRRVGAAAPRQFRAEPAHRFADRLAAARQTAEAQGLLLLQLAAELAPTDGLPTLPPDVAARIALLAEPRRGRAGADDALRSSAASSTAGATPRAAPPPPPSPPAGRRRRRATRRPNGCARSAPP